jgi:hypothetical protein
MPTIPGVRFELRFPYVVTVSSIPLEHVHKVRVNVADEPAPGAAFDEIALTVKGGGTDDLDAYAQAYLALYANAWANTVDFLAPQLWRGLVGSDDMTMISVADFAAVGNGSGTTASHYAMATVRCDDGSILKIAYQEPGYTANSSISYPFSVATFDDIVDHLIGSGSGVLSRQGGVPLWGSKLSGGQNEATWRRRNRF